MFVKIVLLICLAGVGNFVLACPFWQCESSLYGPALDYVDCVKELKESQQCIETAKTQSDICQQCGEYEYNVFTGPEYFNDKKLRFCYTKQCKRNEVKVTCLGQNMMSLILFKDTSRVDAMKSCLDAWQPELDRQMCFRVLYKFNHSASEDPIELFKQVLTEMKNGCDVLLPIAECRKHLAPFAGQIMFGPGSSGPAVDTKAVLEATLTCIQTALKKYPCKTIESLLAKQRASVVQQLVKHFDRGSSMANNYQNECQGDPANQLFSLLYRK